MLLQKLRKNTVDINFVESYNLETFHLKETEQVPAQVRAHEHGGDLCPRSASGDW